MDAAVDPQATHHQPHDPAQHPLYDAHAQEWERTYAMFTHLSLLAAHFVPIVPTLILWLIKRDTSAFIDDHGKEAVNFQISLIIYLVSATVLAMCVIGVPIIIAAYALAIVGMILAAVAANRGQFYRYPMCIRFIK